jgi:Gpi18-like mannosyltransferase
LIASNLTAVIFTLLTASLLFQWGKDKGNLAPIYYLLTPAVFLISPILGYQDSIMSFFILGALLATEKEKYFLAGIAASLAVFSKQLAVMPMFGLGLLLLLNIQWRVITKALLGFVITSVLILSPFIATGTLMAYFHAQALASVHTMMSAQNPNFPWLISLVVRVSSYGIFKAESYSSVPYQIEDQHLRQVIYLAFALLTIAIIGTYLIYWSRKIGTTKISALYVGAISITAYNLFSFGVHENHVYMLLPLLFALINNQKSKKIYLAASSALGLNLLSTGGLGLSFSSFPILAGVNGFVYSMAGGLCLVAYTWTFYELLHQSPEIHLEVHPTA